MTVDREVHHGKVLLATALTRWVFLSWIQHTDWANEAAGGRGQNGSNERSVS